MSDFDTNDAGFTADDEAIQPTVAAPQPARPDLSNLPQVPEHLEEAPADGDSLEGMPVISTPLQEPVAAQTDEKPRKKWPTFLLALLVLVLGAYLAGVVAFMNYFMPNTTLNGADVSLKSAREVADAASEDTQDFSLVVTGQGMNLDIKADSIKVHYDGKTFVREAIKAQHPWRWPLEIAMTHELEVVRGMDYDAMLLDDLVASAVDAINKDAKDPVNASVAFDEGAKHYVVKPEVAGTRLDKAAVTSEVHKAIEQRVTTLELPASVLVAPAVTSTDETLVAAADKANTCLDATQELILRDEVVATVGAEDLQKWVKLNDKLEVTFDSEACTTWARGDLSRKIDTVGSTRNFSTPDGRNLTVSGGTYGWSINGAEIAKTIATNVQAGEKAKIEITWLQEGATWNPGGNEWGDTYIEIDLGAQHVRYFEGGKVVWESDCVSGGLNDGKMHATPAGVYYINSNMESGNVELRGEIDPKTHEPEYISYVKYWMPFIDNGYALHDADWRSSFGGEIYKTSGSHGCVNLPPDKARELYGMVHVGTVVVAHN